MNARQPPGTLDPTAPSVVPDAGALDRQLDAAAGDPALPAQTRALLRKLADELDATRAAVGAERMRYRALFDAVPDPVSVLARDGTVLDLNKAGMAAYKRSREEIVDKNIDVLNPDLPRDHMVPVLDTLDRGETYVVEVTNMRADGTRFEMERGFHAFFRQYYNLRALIRRIDPTLARLTPVTDYPLLGPDGAVAAILGCDGVDVATGVGRASVARIL